MSQSETWNEGKWLELKPQISHQLLLYLDREHEADKEKRTIQNERLMARKLLAALKGLFDKL